MKATLEFDLPEENEEHENALKGGTYRYKLDDIWDKVFRPYYKHGYNDEKLNKLLNSKNGGYIMDKLTEIYRGVVSDD